MEYIIALMACALIAIAAICAMAYFWDSNKGAHNENRPVPELVEVDWTILAERSNGFPQHIEMS